MSFKLDIVVDFAAGSSTNPINVPECSAPLNGGLTALVFLPKGFTPPDLMLQPPLRLASKTVTVDERGDTVCFYVIYVPPNVSLGDCFDYSFSTSDGPVRRETRSANGTIDVSAGDVDPSPSK
ncbi:hypothetical protein [Corallococcus caeni]|uniref:Lipoprotein n=1 Tax=Corallococcus caeni TaxID=3082388 RepID=A0ABQ6R1S6_9BACT|nr:hypothetical protein ASNO1_62350 [Corallococcus sp. NO1]